MCPFSSLLPSTEGPDRFAQTTAKESPPRRKTGSNACERCRRRKIRCDGETPCVTCSRFSLQCIRTQKTKEMLAIEHRQALESRIHLLESQLAAHVSAPVHGLDSIDHSLMEGISTIDWQSPPPSLTVNTSPYGMGNEFDLAPFSASSVPSIAISETQPSPVPSFWSGTTRASSPERQPTSAPQMPFNPGMAIMSQPFSPPMGHQHSLSWDFVTQFQPGHLKPEPSTVNGRSRTTSISSISAGSEEATSANFDNHENNIDIGSLETAHHLPRQGIFSAYGDTNTTGNRSRAIGMIPYPSRFEAETLTSEFLQYLSNFEDDSKPYSLSPSTFNYFCETVYPNLHEPSVDQSVSTAMARFHVFMAMAIGMKVRIKDSSEPTNLLLDRCYELALQQAACSTFWLEQGAVEAAQLVKIFAGVRKEEMFQPRLLQSSCT